MSARERTFRPDRGAAFDTFDEKAFGAQADRFGGGQFTAALGAGGVHKGPSLIWKRAIGLVSPRSASKLPHMKVKAEKVKRQVPFDPVLSATSVLARKPTAKDVADAKERPQDAIEPKEFESMDAMTEDL